MERERESPSQDLLHPETLSMQGRTIIKLDQVESVIVTHAFKANTLTVFEISIPPLSIYLF